MKNIFTFLIKLFVILVFYSCLRDGDDRPPFSTRFTFIEDSSSVGVESNDKKTAFKIVINSIDKIEPKPYFYEFFYKPSTFKLPLEINIPLGEKFEKELYFHPIFADKERLLDLKIYKDGKLLMTKNISYTSIPFGDFKESGQNKNDVLDAGTLLFYTFPYVKIDGFADEDLSIIKLDELAIIIKHRNILAF